MRWMWTLVSVGMFASACSGTGKGDDDDDDDDDGGGASAEDYCNEAADCAESDSQTFDVDDCISETNEAGANAQQAGCASEFRALVACVIDNAECTNGTLITETGCDAVINDYSECNYGGTYYTGTSYTDYTTYGDDDDDETTRGFVGTELHINCDTPTQLNLFVASDVDDGTRAIVDAADTVNQSSYYEAHTLYPTYSERNYTEFDLTMTTGGSYTEGAESLFRCESDLHWGEDIFGSQMSYIVRVYDLSGLYECFAGGNDPDGMLDKDYSDFGNTVDHGDISTASCSTVRSAR